MPLWARGAPMRHDRERKKSCPEQHHSLIPLLKIQKHFVSTQAIWWAGGSKLELLDRRVRETSSWCGYVLCLVPSNPALENSKRSPGKETHGSVFINMFMTLIRNVSLRNTDMNGRCMYTHTYTYVHTHIYTCMFNIYCICCICYCDI